MLICKHAPKTKQAWNFLGEIQYAKLLTEHESSAEATTTIKVPGMTSEIIQCQMKGS